MRSLVQCENGKAGKAGEITSICSLLIIYDKRSLTFTEKRGCFTSVRVIASQIAICILFSSIHHLHLIKLWPNALSYATSSTSYIVEDVHDGSSWIIQSRHLAFLQYTYKLMRRSSDVRKREVKRYSRALL